MNRDDSLSWLQENRRFLLLLAAVILVGGGLNWYLPRAKRARLQESWELLAAVSQDINSAETGSEYNNALAAAKDDDRTYPWALTHAVAMAAARNHNEALETLSGLVNELGEDGFGLSVYENGQAIPFGASLRNRIEGFQRTGELEPESVAPTGRRVKVTLSQGSEKSYELIYGLYEEQAPITTAYFLSLIESGAFDACEIAPYATFGLKVSKLADEVVEPLMIEKAWGCFHDLGCLSTDLDPGAEPGSQSAASFTLFTRESWTQDGTTTVFGKIVEGEDHLAELLDLPRDAAGTQFEPAMTLKVELLP